MFLVNFIPLGMIFLWFPFTFWFMLRVISLMQRIATELESISQSIQARP